METISNVASGVSKAIWGDSDAANTTHGNETAGQEPISGAKGAGTVNSPYDQGNAENPTDPTGKPLGIYNAASSLPDTENKPSTTSMNTTSDTTPGTNSGTGSDSVSNNTTDIKPAPNTSSTGRTDPTSHSASTPNMTSTTGTETTPKVPNNPINAVSGGHEASDPLKNTDNTGVTSKPGNSVGGSDVIPSNAASNPGAAPMSGGSDQQKQQGADRPKDAPSGEQVGAVSDSKDKGEEALKKRDPNDHSGEPMHMHNGPEKNVPDTQEERRTSKVGMPGGQPHGEETKGTGEQWVKTSGLAAEGGDFDATKPGAGREADRLLEQKGVHKTETGAGGGASTESHDASGGKEKVSMGEKIKNKLHIGHKDK